MAHRLSMEEIYKNFRCLSAGEAIRQVLVFDTTTP